LCERSLYSTFRNKPLNRKKEAMKSTLHSFIKVLIPQESVARDQLEDGIILEILSMFEKKRRGKGKIPSTEIARTIQYLYYQASGKDNLIRPPELNRLAKLLINSWNTSTAFKFIAGPKRGRRPKSSV